jgi:hypothetical protein
MEETIPDGNGDSGKETGASGRDGGGKSRRATSRSIARWNALKHGVLSETVVLPTEDKAQFQELLEHLCGDLKPEGALEELLVERIATCFWRLRRVLRYDFGNHGVEGSAARRAYVDAESRLKKLTDLKQEVAQSGFRDDLKTRLFEMVTVNGKPSESALPQVLDLAIQMTKSSTEDAKAKAEEAGLTGALPKRMDTLLRYETANERQLYRAIDQLERLQRQRAGDYVPPPVKLGVSTDV